MVLTDDRLARENPIGTEDNVSREAVANDQTQARGVIVVESWDDQSHGTGLRPDPGYAQQRGISSIGKRTDQMRW
jgi:hypothetical protein